MKVWRPDTKVLTLHHQPSLTVVHQGVPLAVCTGFPIVDHGRPAQWKVANTENEAQLVVVQTLRTIADPKRGPLGVAKVAPLPSFVVPKLLIPVATSFNKLKILAICDGKLTSAKRWDMNMQPTVLNIPAV